MSDLFPPWQRRTPALPEWHSYSCPFSFCKQRKYTTLQPPCPIHRVLMTLVPDQKTSGGQRG